MNPNGQLKFHDLFLAAAAMVTNIPWMSVQPDPDDGRQLAVFFADTPALRQFLTDYHADRVHVPARAYMKVYNSLMTQVRQRRVQSTRNPFAKETRHHAEDPQSR